MSPLCAVVDSNDAIEVAGDDGAIRCRDGRRDSGVTERSALSANVFLHTTPKNVLRCWRLTADTAGARGGGVEPFSVAGVIHVVDWHKHG